MKKHLTLALTLLTLICSSAQAQLPSYLPADGLVGWWPFNGNANDESGNGNEGVVNGAVLVEDRFGNAANAYTFQAVHNVIDLPEIDVNIGSVNSSSAFSIWFRGEASLSNNTVGVLLSAGAAPYDYQIRFEVFRSGGIGPKIYYRCPAENDEPGYINNYDASSWHNIIVSIDGTSGQYNYYFDGTIIPQMSFVFNGANNYYNPARLWKIGTINPWPSNPSHQFYGDIDDIAIYNRALTESEIQNLYTGNTPAACFDLPANLQDGLVGYWPFCGNANDESGNGNDAEVYGSVLAEDRHGNAQAAYSFNGTSDFLKIPSAPTFSEMNDFTISCWLKKNSSFINRQELLSKDIDGAPINGDWGLHLENYRYTFEINGGGPTYFAETNLTSDSSIWQSIVVTRSQSDGRVMIHVNGILDTVFIGTLTPVSNNQDIFIGRNAVLNSAYFNGLIDDITIYNRVLTPEEVTQLYAVQSTGDPTAGGGNVTTGPLSNVPRGISYQAVARDAQGQAIASSPVNVRFTLHQGTPTGTTEYSETHALTTSEIGLFSTYFGSGTAITSAFDSIVWSNTTKFLQVEIDLGNGYVDMGTQQLMSVPFAYRANEAAEAGTIRNNALSVYPDNTAALVGGLVAGEMYRTATGDLKVVY